MLSPIQLLNPRVDYDTDEEWLARIKEYTSKQRVDNVYCLKVWETILNYTYTPIDALPRNAYTVLSEGRWFADRICYIGDSGASSDVGVRVCLHGRRPRSPNSLGADIMGTGVGAWPGKPESNCVIVTFSGLNRGEG